MSSVDQRVVEMKFNNSAFAKGIADTLTGLQKLQDGLKLDGASKGIEDVSAAAGRFDSSKMEDGAGRIGVKFSAMQAIALGALTQIGAKALDMGKNLIQSVTGLDSMKQGFQEYETNMTSIQTILANTQASGATLTDVNGALDQLNTYSDQTIYNFSEMAKNIGTFTAAGVALGPATASIKGIANLAALSGSNSQQASGAMYQLSQAISAGRVSLQDWNSVVNAGMGGTVFQRALAQNAEKMGTLSKGAVTLTGDMKTVTVAGKSFRDSIDATNGPSWLTSDVLTQTLQQFTGDLSDADLAAQGFNASEIETIQSQAKTAKNAATEVKTFSGLMDTLKEGVGSGWGQTFKIIIGDFEEAKSLFTNLSNNIGGFLGRMADSRNKMLKEWKDNGGRDALIDGLGAAFGVLAGPLDRIGKAFRSVFPKETGVQLAELTKNFRDFMEDLQPAPETLERIQRTAAGFFAILHIGWTIVKGLAGFLVDMFAGFNDGDQGILRTTATIGDFFVGLDKAISHGRVIPEFFDAMRDALFKVLNPLRDFGQTIGKLFESGGDMTATGDQAGQFITNLLSLGSIGEALNKVWGGLGRIFTATKQAIGDAISGISEWFSQFGIDFNSAFEGLDFDKIMKVLQAGLGAGLLLVLKNLAASLGDFSIFGSSGGGFLDAAKEALEGVSGTMQAMQTNLKANALLKIAGAIAVMTAAVFVLAGIDSDGLKRAVIALTIMFVQLGVMMKALDTISSTGSAIKLTILGFGLIAVAIAVTILASAVKKLAELELGDMLRGLLGLSIMLKILTSAVQGMSGQASGMIRTGASLILLAVAVKILVSAVQDLSSMGWEELAKGLTGVAVLLGALALFTKFADADKGGLSQGLGILLIAAALKLLASAVKDFATMSWEEMSKGLVGVSVGLIAIAAALRLIPQGAIFSAAAVLIVAASLGIIADAMRDMGQMDWETIAKGLVVMGISLQLIASALKQLPPSTLLSAAAIFIAAAALGMIADALVVMGGMSMGDTVQALVLLGASLLIISIALKAMQNSIAGAIALTIFAAALTVLNGVLQQFGDMSVEEIVKSLGMLAAVFVILGIAGTVLAPVTLVLLGLGAAILLLGAGVILAGAGVMLFAAALTALAAAGTVGVAVIVAIVTSLLGLLPVVAAAIGEAIIAFALVIATAGPAILGAITAVLLAFLQAIIDVTPKVGEALLQMIFTLLGVLEQAVPRLVSAGMNLIVGILRGVGDRIGDVVDAAADIIVNFLDGLSRNLPRIIQSGIDLIVSFVNGLADGIRNNSAAMGEAGGNLATAIVEGMVNGIKGGAGKIISEAKNMAKNALNAAKDFLGINSPSKEFHDVGKWSSVGMAEGIEAYSGVAADAAQGVGENILDTMGKTISGLGALVGSNMEDLNPVITPVLDLSAVQRGSSSIGDLLGAAPIDLSGAYSRAAMAAGGVAANQASMQELLDSAGTTNNFTQINNSPKALSQADIYRQTNNQISKAKGVRT